MDNTYEQFKLNAAIAVAGILIDKVNSAQLMDKQTLCLYFDSLVDGLMMRQLDELNQLLMRENVND